MRTTSLLVLVGSPLRRDDGVAGALRAEILARNPQQEIALLETDASHLFELLEGRDSVVLVDACTGLGIPVRAFDVASRPLPADLRLGGSHQLGVEACLELMRSLGKLPKRAWLVAIEGRDFGYGEGLSEAARAAIPEAVRVVSGLLATAEALS